MGEEILTGAEITKRQLYHQYHHSREAIYKLWEPGAHCTFYRQLNSLKNVFSKCFSWSKALLGNCWFLLLPYSWSDLRLLCRLACWKESLNSLASLSDRDTQ